MTRSPFYPAMARGVDVDAGGAAELQTDVMRFMAILSLCLVAIFALVQSLPAANQVESTVSPAQAEAIPVEPPPSVAVAEPEPARATPVAVPRQVSTTAAVAQPEKPLEATHEKPPVPQKAVVPTPKDPSPAQQPSVPERTGFTLRFESDEVLTRLVSGNEVGLYVIAPQQSLRLGKEGSRLNFWPASTPGQFHEMDAGTVPVEVKRALLRSGADLSSDPQWGVTLPARTESELQQFLANASGGSLIIGANGDLRLEP
jgi:hypothetical protein